MICVLCRQKIDTSKPDSYEEVPSGSIEFAHVTCKDKAEGIETADAREETFR